MIAIDRTLCDTCGTCVGVCPADALRIEFDLLVRDRERCCGCGECLIVCPVKALSEEP